MKLKIIHLKELFATRGIVPHWGRVEPNLAWNENLCIYWGHTILYSNQSDFVNGRFIGKGIPYHTEAIPYYIPTNPVLLKVVLLEKVFVLCRTLLDINADENNFCGLALQLDFEKALNSVEWKLLIGNCL